MEIRLDKLKEHIDKKIAETIVDFKKDFIEAMRADIMKLQTYKMFPYEDTVYVERDDVMKIFEKYTEGESKDAELEALDEKVSSSEKPNKWIPVSESMPPFGQDVLVCDLDGDMYITYLHLNGTWGFEYCGNKIKNVTAWQELPLPYKVESEE